MSKQAQRINSKALPKGIREERMRESKRRMCDGITYQGHDHREEIEQLIKINDILLFMCEGGTRFDAEDVKTILDGLLFIASCSIIYF